MTALAPISRTAVEWASSRVLLTGGHGFLGRAVSRVLMGRGVVGANLVTPRSREFDLRDPQSTQRLFEIARPDIVIHCAGLVGGLALNRDQPARMFHDNMAMALTVIDHWRAWCERWPGARERGTLVFIGSMTSYPASAPMPLREESLWSGPVDAMSAPYGIAKLAALTFLEACHRQHGTPSAYLIPTNLYGPGDNLDDPAKAHAAGSLIKRFVGAARTTPPSSLPPEAVCWGTGAPTRQFLYVDDAAEAVVRAAECRIGSSAWPIPINIAPPVSDEVSIRDLSELIARLAGYRGAIRWDVSKPEGQARRCLDAERAKTLLGWEASTSLEAGLRSTIAWYRSRAGSR